MDAISAKQGMTIKGENSPIKSVIRKPPACPGNVHITFTSGKIWCIAATEQVEQQNV